jgi:hypothetical protein
MCIQPSIASLATNHFSLGIVLIRKSMFILQGVSSNSVPKVSEPHKYKSLLETLAVELAMQVYLLAGLRLSDQLLPPGMNFLIMYITCRSRITLVRLNLDCSIGDCCGNSWIFFFYYEWFLHVWCGSTSRPELRHGWVTAHVSAGKRSCRISKVTYSVSLVEWELNHTWQQNWMGVDEGSRDTHVLRRRPISSDFPMIFSFFHSLVPWYLRSRTRDADMSCQR